MTPLDFADYLLESQKRSHSEFNSGTTWGQISLLLQTNEDLEEYIQSRTGMRTTKLYEVRLQLHQAKELAGMNKPDSFDPTLIPLALKANHEYTIEVTPVGQSPSLKIVQRNCLLNHEIDVSSAFTKYTEANCRYDCRVKLSAEVCKCVPWDFLHVFPADECDVFGRTCFYRSMKNITQYPIDECSHCIQECDYIIFKKIQVSETMITQERSPFEAGFGSKNLRCFHNKKDEEKCWGQK